MSPEAWGATGTMMGVVGTTITVIYSRIQIADKKNHDLEMDGVNDGIKRLESSQTAAWNRIDDLRINAVRREDQEKLRNELRADVKELGDRLEAAINTLRIEMRGAHG